MGVTTRGGKARTLEYDKHEDLITKEESLKRVDILLIILTFILNFSLLFCLLIFGIIHSEKFYLEDQTFNPIVPSLSLYLLRISHNSEVFVHNIFMDKRSAIKVKSRNNDEPFLKLAQFDYIYPYVYNQELHFNYGKTRKGFMFLQQALDTNIVKKFYSGKIYDSQLEEYSFISPPSFVQFGSHVWLYGNICIMIQQKSIMHDFFFN